MPNKECQRCACCLNGKASRALDHPLPAALMMEGKSKDGLGILCSSCRRRLDQHYQDLRNKPGPSLRSAAIDLPPPRDKARKAPTRVSEVEQLRAIASKIEYLGESSTCATRGTRTHATDMYTDSSVHASDPSGAPEAYRASQQLSGVSSAAPPACAAHPAASMSARTANRASADASMPLSLIHI